MRVNVEKILIIVRGLPSSGKTSFGKLLGTKAICSADDYITHKGVYMWKPETVSKSHDWCQRKCRRFMQIGAQRIVIANTNTTAREMQPYIDMAKRYGYVYYSVIVEKRHENFNDHGVPQQTLEKMKDRFEIKLV